MLATSVTAAALRFMSGKNTRRPSAKIHRLISKIRDSDTIELEIHCKDDGQYFSILDSVRSMKLTNCTVETDLGLYSANSAALAIRTLP